MKTYILLLPLLLLGQSNLWFWQIKEQTTREEIQVELLQKQQELEVLLTTNNEALLPFWKIHFVFQKKKAILRGRISLKRSIQINI